MSGAIAFMTMSLIALRDLRVLRAAAAMTSSPRISRSRSAGAGVSYGSTPVSIWYIVTPSE